MLSYVTPPDVSTITSLPFLEQSFVAYFWHNFRRDACFTFSGLHTNYSLMEELVACKKAVAKVVPGAPNV